MSGTVTNNTLRDSGGIAATAAGLNWVSTVVTGSTVTVESGNGYWINTTSNTCTITLPSSAEKGDQIVFIDYARTWGTNKVIIDSNGLNYQGQDDSYTVEYNISGQSLNIVYSDATKGWIPLDDDATALEPVQPPSQKGIYAFGTTGSAVSVSNLVSSSGVIASDTTGVGTARLGLGASSFGGDKAIFAFGSNSGGQSNLSNLVSNGGVVATDTTGVGSAREGISAAFGGDRAIFFGGVTANGIANASAVSNLVANTGVVASNTSGASGVGVRIQQIMSPFGADGKAIIAFGTIANETATNIRNLISNAGVIAADISGAGGVKTGAASAKYGSGLAIAAFGNANGSATATAEFNFGNPPYANSSSVSDGNGHGNFEFAVPSGYFAICTKNLAENG